MLKGDKVVLRALEENDFQAWYHMNDEVALTLQADAGWAPLTEDLAHERWQHMLHASAEARVNFAIEVEREFIGYISIKEIRRQSQNALLAIWIGAPDKLGRGYGRDAIRVALRWAFNVHNLHRIQLTTWATNERAIRAYRAAGFVEEGRLRDGVWLDGQFVDVVVMGALRPEWLQQDQQSRL